MATTTLAALLNLMCDRYGLGRRGTNSGTVATSLTDVSLGGLSGYGGADGLEVGCSVVITAGTRVGDITQLSSRPKLTTGLANVEPDFGGVLAINSQYIIFYPELRYTGGGLGVLDAINAALANFAWEKRIVPVTLVADGDMLASAATSWTAQPTGTTSKVAGLFPLGHRVLRMTGAAANDYAVSSSIGVEPSGTYYLEALGKIGVATHTGTLVLYDDTNGANITLSETLIDTFEPLLLVNTSVAIPSTCKQVLIRLEADGAGDTVDWAWVILRKNDQQRFVLRDRPQRILRIGQLRAMSASNWQSHSWDAMREVPYEAVQSDAGIWELHVNENLAGLSVWYEEFVEPAQLSAMTDTTNVPDEELAAVASELVLRPMKSKSREWAERYAKAAYAAAGVIDRYQELLTYVNRTQRRVAYRYA